MPKKALINVFLFAIMVFSTIAFIGFIIWNQPHRNIMGAPAIKIVAVDLYRVLYHDSIRMKSLFIDKVVTVKGKVKKVQNNREGAQVILLQTNVEGASVNCTMEQNIRGIRAGQTIEIKGICMGYISGDDAIGLPGDVYLTRGYPTS